MASYTDIEIDQGSSKNILFQWFDSSTNLPMDLTGFSAVMRVRKSYGADDILLELSTANNKIDLLETPNSIVLILSSTDTADMDEYNCVYELVLTRPDSTSFSFLKGRFTLLQNVV